MAKRLYTYGLTFVLTLFVVTYLVNPTSHLIGRDQLKAFQNSDRTHTIISSPYKSTSTSPFENNIINVAEEEVEENELSQSNGAFQVLYFFYILPSSFFNKIQLKSHHDQSDSPGLSKAGLFLMNRILLI